MCLLRVCGPVVGDRVLGYVALAHRTAEMTTNPAPGVKLDPEVLADTVPLRRVGTIQVCSCATSVRIL